MFIVGIISVIIYIVAVVMVYTNIYEFKKDEKIKFTVIGIFVVLIITWIVVLISSKGLQVENKEIMKIAKKTSTFLFAPINTILALPYLGNLLNKIKQEKLKEYDFKKKLIIFAVILLLAVIIEKSYIKSFEMGLIKNAIK